MGLPGTSVEEKKQILSENPTWKFVFFYVTPKWISIIEVRLFMIFNLNHFKTGINHLKIILYGLIYIILPVFCKCHKITWNYVKINCLYFILSLVTYSRRCLGQAKMPHWKKSNKEFKKLRVDVNGTIEDPINQGIGFWF